VDGHGGVLAASRCRGRSCVDDLAIVAVVFLGSRIRETCMRLIYVAFFAAGIFAWERACDKSSYGGCHF
jgi:hypothetical protein